jgi:hypothetical protein
MGCQSSCWTPKVGGVGGGVREAPRREVLFIWWRRRGGKAPTSYQVLDSLWSYPW